MFIIYDTLRVDGVEHRARTARNIGLIFLLILLLILLRGFILVFVFPFILLVFL